VVMTLDDLEEISSVLAHEVYYLIQEALINTAKHAQATTAHVRLGSQDDQVHIVVADDGGGFPFRGRYDLAALTESALGPASLKARIVSLAGEFIIDSTECGARLKITLPLRSG